MTRPIDTVIEFLTAEQARGRTHIPLDADAKAGLRALYQQAKRTPDAPGSRQEVPNQVPQATVAPANLSLPEGTREEQLEALRQHAAAWPPALQLGTLRDTMVFSTGNPRARIVLVGEAPGYEEERQQEPFVGPAGKKLNDILKAMNLSREEVYITNIVKFRPAMPRQTTNNRKPSAEEMAACIEFVRREISIIRPECIIALGGTAGEGLLGLAGPVREMRTSWYDFEGIPARVTYHPSYLLQSGGSNQIKRQLWEDMLAVMEKLDLPISDKQRAYFLPKE